MSDLLSIYKELQAKKWVDLSHQINAESPHFPALPALQQEDLFTLKDGFHVQPQRSPLATLCYRQV